MSKNMRLKREMAKVLSVALVGSMTVMPVRAEYATQNDYVNHWAKEAIEKWSQKGIILGFEDGNFKPKNNLTRGELAALLTRVFGLTETSDAKNYEDVDQAKWYAEDIAKVSAAGMMHDEGSSFRPDDYATREEAVYALAAAYKITGESQKIFHDAVKISDWAAPMIEAMVSGGYISGRTDGNFAPQDLLTRADMITMIDKITADLINEAGTYTQDVEGNLVINTKDVVLENINIKGNLYLAEGIGKGTVTLKNVTIDGHAYVESNETKAVLTGTFAEVTMPAGAKVQLKAAAVNKLTVAEGSTEKAVIDMDKDSKVVQLAANGAVKTTGNGTITELVVNAQGVEVAQTPEKITNPESIKVTIPAGTSGSTSSSSGSSSSGGGTSDDTNISVKGISLDVTELTLKPEETRQLTATFNPVNASNQNVTWASTHPEIAAVDANGKVTALKTGSALITVTTQAGKYEAACQVNVGIDMNTVTEGATYKVKTEEVALEGLSVELPFKLQTAGHFTVTYAELEKVAGFSLEGDTVKVTNDVADDAVYTLSYIVEADHRIIEGKVEITATNEIAEVESVTLDRSEVMLKTAEEIQLTASLSPKDATNQEVTWASSDETVAIVDGNGKVTAMAPGEAMITVITKDGGFMADCQVKVGVDLGSVTEGAAYKVTTEEVTPAGLSVELPFKLQAAEHFSVAYAELEEVNGFSLEGDTVKVTNNVADGAVYALSYTVKIDERTVVGKIEITAANAVAEVESVNLNQSEIILKKDGEAQLTASFNPIDATNQEVAWASSDENVARVDANGKVTAMAPGEATITVITKDGGFMAACQVKVGADLEAVTEGAAYKVTTEEVTPAGLSVELPFKLQAAEHFSVAYAELEKVNGFSLEGDTVKVTNDVADGAVYALSYTVKIDERTVVGKIEITAANAVAEVESVNLNQSEIILKKGDEAQLTAFINPKDATNQNVTWSSSNEAIAKVDAEGKVTAVGTGSAMITVTTEEGHFEAKCVIKVGVNSVVVESGNYEVQTKEVTPEGLIVELPFKTIEGNYEVSYTEVEAVNGFSLEGETVKVANTVADGSTYTLDYTVVIGDKTMTGTIIIKATNEIIEVEAVTLNETAVTLQEAEEIKLTATINPSHATNQEVTWRSSDENVAAVDENGNVRAAGAGTAVITVTTKDGSFTAECVITVEREEVDTVIPVERVELNHKTLTMDRTETFQLIATVYPTNATNQELIWISSKPEKVTVDEKGILRGQNNGSGTATITVTTKDGKYEASCKVKVK